jgi:hypothetical protein
MRRGPGESGEEFFFSNFKLNCNDIETIIGVIDFLFCMLFCFYMWFSTLVTAEAE